MHYEEIDKIIVVWKLPPWKMSVHSKDNKKNETTRTMDSMKEHEPERQVNMPPAHPWECKDPQQHHGNGDFHRLRKNTNFHIYKQTFCYTMRHSLMHWLKKYKIVIYMIDISEGCR